jgi:hypothetical protein
VFIDSKPHSAQLFHFAFRIDFIGIGVATILSSTGGMMRVGSFITCLCFVLSSLTVDAASVTGVMNALKFATKASNGRKANSVINLPGNAKVVSAAGNTVQRLRLRPDWLSTTEKYDVTELAGAFVRLKKSETGKIIPSHNSITDMAKAGGNSLKLDANGKQRVASTYKALLNEDGRSVAVSFGDVPGTTNVALPAELKGQIIHYEFDFSVEGMPKLKLWTWGKESERREIVVPMLKMKYETKVAWKSRSLRPLNASEIANAKASLQIIEPLAPRKLGGAGFKAARSN